MTAMIVLFVVCFVAFLIYLPFASKVRSSEEMLSRLIAFGLGGAVTGLLFREAPIFALVRFVVVDAAYILAYVIIKMMLPSFIERYRGKRKGKPKNDDLIEFDGEVYPVVDEQTDKEAGL